MTEEEGLTPEVIRSEVNLLTFPFFALSRKGLRSKRKTEYRAVVERDNQKLEILWQVTSNSEYGYPGPFDQKIHKAVEEIINALSLPVENPISYSLYDVCRRMGLKQIGGTDYRKIKEGIERIVATTVKSKGTFYSKGRKAWIDDTFHLYDRVIFKGQKLPDGTVAETNLLYLNAFYLDNLNARYVRPLDYEYYRALNSNVAQRLYELLGVKFYGVIRKGLPHLCYRYSTLCQLLPLTHQRYLSKAKQVLGPAHDELIDTGFLERVDWEVEEVSDEGWLIFYYPGGRAREEVERYQEPEEPQVLVAEQLELLASRSSEEEAELQALVDEMVAVLGDKKSRPFYEKVTRRCPRNLIFQVLSEIKHDWRKGEIKATKGAAFTDRIKRYCQERGIELGLKGQ